MDAAATTPDFAALAAELSPALLRYLRRYTGDVGSADDLLQETLIRMARGLADFEGRSSPKTWAFAIATRVAADHFRSPAQRAAIVAIDEADSVADPAPLAEEQRVVDEMNACIRQVIDSLPEDYRAALVLHDLEGQSAREIAEICGATLATVKIRIHRARARLKQALDRQCDFYRDGENVFRCDRKGA
ncbi:MAG: RNA polymerase subunit sigma-24 [Rhodocyclales bacterium GWA2_65_19]|nr:MAG: RNA polymerase subunit sigma-24 [Rhodocyclales bacterium GWA2_65_19]